MRLCKFLFAYVAVILLAYALHFLTGSPVFPPPHRSIAYFVTRIPLILPHLLGSFGRIAIANVFAYCAGMALGIACVSKKTGAVFSPILDAYTAIPAIVIFPILAGLFGFPEWILIATLFCAFLIPFARAVRDALEGMDPNLRAYADSMGLTPKSRLVHFTIPATLPAIFRVSVRMQGFAFVVLFFTESFSQRPGIGGYVMDAWATGNFLTMNAGIIGAFVLASLIYLALGVLERFLCPHLDQCPCGGAPSLAEAASRPRRRLRK